MTHIGIWRVAGAFLGRVTALTPDSRPDRPDWRAKTDEQVAVLVEEARRAEVDPLLAWAMERDPWITKKTRVVSLGIQDQTGDPRFPELATAEYVERLAGWDWREDPAG